MRRGPDRLNSAGLTLIGLLLLAAGAYGLARGYGALGDRRASDPVLGDSVRDFVSSNDDWFWPAAAALSLVVAYLGFRWLLAQVHTPHPSRLRVTSDPDLGTTDLSAPGAAAALAADVEEYPGVQSARARLLSEGPSPEVDLTVELADDADMADVRRRIDEHALPRFAGALEVATLRPRVHLRLAQPAGRTIR